MPLTRDELQQAVAATLMAILLENKHGMAMIDIEDAIARYNLTQEVAEKFGANTDPAYRRTYILRRLKDLQKLGWVVKEGEMAQFTTWRAVPEKFRLDMLGRAPRRSHRGK